MKFKIGDKVVHADRATAATVIGYLQVSPRDYIIVDKDILGQRCGNTLKEWCRGNDAVYDYEKFHNRKNFGIFQEYELVYASEPLFKDSKNDTNEKYSVETVKEIWNNKTGEHIEVGPDRDSLDLVEVRQYDDCNYSKSSNRMTFSREQAILVAEAILDLYKKKS